MPLLEIAGAAKHFGAVAAVDDVSLSVERGALFRAARAVGLRQDDPAAHDRRFRDARQRPDRHRRGRCDRVPPYARPVNMMFQSYALFPHIDVAGNIAFGLRQERMDRRRLAARVDEMLALVQMSDYARRRPHELSGGQRQRVALARALAKMPKLLLLDEPLAALDRKLREETRLELIGIQERVGITFLVVTHDQEEALGMASRIAVMDQGRLVQIGTPAEIYERPDSRFVADFVGEVNLFEGELIAGFNCPGARRRGLDRADPAALRHQLPEGAAAALAVRPEKLVLSHAPPIGFAIAATVSSIGYQGGGSMVHLATEQGMALKAHLPSAAAAGFGRGAPVWASWAPEDGRGPDAMIGFGMDRPAGADRAAVSVARAVFSAAAADRRQDQPGREHDRDTALYAALRHAAAASKCTRHWRISR